MKLGEVCILGEGVWPLPLWLLQRTLRLSVFSDAEADKQLEERGRRQKRMSPTSPRQLQRLASGVPTRAD